MPNKYWNDDAAPEFYGNGNSIGANPNYKFRLQGNEKIADNYPGKQDKCGGGNIGMSKSNNSKDIGLSGKKSGDIGTSGKKSGYDANDSMLGGKN